MQAIILLAFMSGASAFLKASTSKNAQSAAEVKLSNWEQMQEDAMDRIHQLIGVGLPKTVIHVGEAPPSDPERFLMMVTEVTIKARECGQCVEEHFDDISGFEDHFGDKIQALTGEKYVEACAFCTLYAFGGIYAGKGALVHEKAWQSLPADKISVMKDESILASPPRKDFWKEAAKKVVYGTWNLTEAIAEEGSAMNVLECATNEDLLDTSCKVLKGEDKILEVSSKIGRKESENTASLLQTQKIDMDLEQDMPMIKGAVEDAVSYVQSGQEEEDGSAVLNAAMRLMMPITKLAGFRKSTDHQSNMEKLTKMDEVVRKFTSELTAADTAPVAQGTAVQSLEKAAKLLYKQVLTESSDDEIATQSKAIAKRLAKLLPQKKLQEKKMRLKAKKAEPVIRKGEDADNEAMKALASVFGTHKETSLVQKQASHEDLTKMDKAMDALTDYDEKAEEAAEHTSLEFDLAHLAGQDKHMHHEDDGQDSDGQDKPMEHEDM